MAYERKPGDVVLFYNKSESANAPKYKGRVLGLNGEELEIALWEKFSGSGGQMFFSGKISVPRRVENGPQTKNERVPNKQGMDDDLPF